MDRELFDALEVAVFLILYLIHVYYVIKYYNENKHLKEENKRLQDDLLQQANENLRLKNNISTDTVE